MIADRLRAWLAGFSLAATVSACAFVLRVGLGNTGLGDAAAIRLMEWPAGLLGTELSPTFLPVATGFVETLVGGFAGACIAGLVGGGMTWRGRTFLILVVTLGLQLLASYPISFG